MLALFLFTLLAAVSAAPQAAPTDEASAAQSTDPNFECSYYNYAPVTAMTPSYPPIWVQPAVIPAADTAAQALYNSMAPNIPNIPPRGNATGVSFTGYDPSDPDCWWSYAKCTKPKLAGIPSPDITQCPEANVWGLTYDDGPNCSHNAFYDFLQSNNQKATLFYIGSNVFDWPLEAQRGLADGHEVCAHTWSHPYMTGISSESVFAELYYSKKAIKDVLGITVQCWRPPFGDCDDRVRYIANQLGMATIIWEEDTQDWYWQSIGIPAVENNYNNIIALGKNGSYGSTGPIVLSHELVNETMTLAEQFYPQIKSTFSHVTPVAVCWNNTHPYMEDSVIYPNFNQWVAGTVSVTIPSPTSAAPVVPSYIAAGAAGPYTVSPSASGGVSSSSSGGTGSTTGTGSKPGATGSHSSARSTLATPVWGALAAVVLAAAAGAWCV